VDLVSKEAVDLGLMSPLCIEVGIGSKTLALLGAGADFDAKLAGTRPEVSGVHGSVDGFVDEAYGDGVEGPLDGIIGMELGLVSP
jgi:hypothetical protein